MMLLNYSKMFYKKLLISLKHVNSIIKDIQSNSSLMVPMIIIMNAQMLFLMLSNMLLLSYQKSKKNNLKIFLKKSLKLLKKFKMLSLSVKLKQNLFLSNLLAHSDTPNSIHHLSQIFQSKNSTNSKLMNLFKSYLGYNNIEHIILV